MAATRRNIAAGTAAADRDAANFVQACLALKQEPSGIGTDDVGIGPGPLAVRRDLSTWDLFVIWHVWAMQEMSPDFSRNAAHMGPVFLPWHRWYLIVLEFHMQRVLGVGRDDFGLPYWDWSADGTNFTAAQQRTRPAVWGVVGGDGNGPVGELTDGPFTAANGFGVTIEQGPGGALRATDRGLRRRFGVSINRLPRQTDYDAALTEDLYDQAGWNAGSIGFRNRLEGWIPSPSGPAPAMHNRVHVWVGGDMGPGSSPNDPVFFLNHCFVDKVWSDWQGQPGDRSYRPAGRSAPGDPLFRHRVLDPLFSILTTTQPPVGAMEDVAAFYTYE